MEQHTSYQLGDVIGFLLVSVTAFVVSSFFGTGYVVGLVFGFGIGLSVAVFQYGIVVETESKARGYPTKVARKIDQVFE